MIYRACLLLAIAVPLLGCDMATDSSPPDDDEATRKLEILAQSTGNSDPIRDARQVAFVYDPAADEEYPIPGGVDLTPLVEAAGSEKAVFLFWSLGEKPTGGYAVRITEVTLAGQALQVAATITEPAEDAMVTQALTHPYAVAAVEHVDYESVEWTGD